MGKINCKPIIETTNKPLTRQDSVPQAQIRDVWDVVGADNIPEFPVDNIVLQDKMSMLLYGIFLRDDEDRAAELLQKQVIDMPAGGNQPMLLDWTTPPFKPGKKNFTKLKSYIVLPNYLYARFSFAVRFNVDYGRMDYQMEALGVKQSSYSNYKLDKAYNIIPLPFTNSNEDTLVVKALDINEYEQCLIGHFETGFPYYLKDKTHARFPVFESSSLKMQFIFRGKTPQESMLVAKDISFCSVPNSPHLCPSKHYYPVLFLRDNCGDVYSVFAGLPGKKEKYLPLYNALGIERIEKAESVVICGTIEDADAMQRYAEEKKDKKKAFTAFVCDPGNLDQVDFSPLKGKKVVLLISNHGGIPIEEERKRVHALYVHLKEMPQRPRIKGFSFIEREVKYPQNISTLEEYYNAYAYPKSKVVKKKEYTEAEFVARFETLSNMSASNEQTESVETDAGESASTSLSKTRHPGRPRHRNLTAEKTILRPFIRRGCTTVLTGDPGIGKSRFTIALAAQVAGSKKEFLTDRLWTRCLPAKDEKSGFKVVYWVFDDVNQDDIDLQRNFFARGLSKDQEKNLIIEPARSIMKRDCESLKEELKKYSSRGTPNHPVDLLIVDTLLSFARSPAKIFSAFEELVRLKDELPGLAILLIHHNSKEGNPFGGVLATNMPRVIIEMKRDNPSVTDDLRDPITVNIIKHSNEHFGIDVVPFEIRLDGDHFIVTNNPDLPQDTIKKLVIYEYKTNLLEQYSSTDIGRLLGVPRKRIEKVWNKDVEAEAKDLWNNLRIKLKAEAKALNETSVRKKTSTRNKPVENSQASNENGETGS